MFVGVKEIDGSIRRIAFSVSGQDFVKFLDNMKQNPVYYHGRKLSSTSYVDHDISYSVYFEDIDGNKLELTSYDYNYSHDALKK